MLDDGSRELFFFLNVMLLLLYNSHDNTKTAQQKQNPPLKCHQVFNENKVHGGKSHVLCFRPNHLRKYADLRAEMYME